MILLKLIRSRPCTILGLGVALLLAPLRAAIADPLAYEVTEPTDLFGTVDLTTGAFKQTSALGFDPAGIGEVGGMLYVSVFDGTAFDRINPATGALTAISNTGPGGGVYLALGSTQNGLYALDDSFNLYRIDPATGVGTLIGPTGLAQTEAYQLSTGSSVLYFANANELYSLNTNTGAATDIGSTSLPPFGFDALVSQDGVLYGGHDAGVFTTFYSIDPATAAVTLGATQDAEVGVAWGLAPAPIPEPGSLAVLGTALLAFGPFFCRSKRWADAARRSE